MTIENNFMKMIALIMRWLMATIKDIAKKAGVSITTVSRVLNNTAPVNEETRKAVLRVIEETNYTPSIVAQGMRTKKSKTLSVIIPDYKNPFYYELFKHIEDAARNEGYHVMITSTREDAIDEIAYINELLNRNIDGIILFSYKGDKETLEYLLRLTSKLPVVFMDNLEVNKQVNMVYTDGYKGIREITKHLIDLGHKEIAFIKPIPRYKSASDRYDAFVDTVRNSGLVLRPELIYEGDYHIESGYKAAEYFLTGDRVKPTAIVSSTDLMAIGALNYIKSKGLRIPEDVAVAGYDDIYMSRIMHPPITTYRQPLRDIADEAIGILMNKINHPSAKNRKAVLNGKLMIRRSTDIMKPEVELI